MILCITGLVYGLVYGVLVRVKRCCEGVLWTGQAR